MSKFEFDPEDGPDEIAAKFAEAAQLAEEHENIKRALKQERDELKAFRQQAEAAEAAKRTSLLESFPEDLRASLSDLSVEKLEVLAPRFTAPEPEPVKTPFVEPTSGGVPSGTQKMTRKQFDALMRSDPSRALQMRPEEVEWNHDEALTR